MQLNKGIKLVLILLAVYVGIVVLFEFSLGFFQPESGNTIVIETFDAEGNGYTRVVSLLTSASNEYVAVNHWPCAWYRRLEETPRIGVTRDGGKRSSVPAWSRGLNTTGCRPTILHRSHLDF
jgi:hypothetical protein